MDTVSSQLDRLRRGWARVRGGDAIRRVHLLVLAGAFLLALASRVLGPFPPFGALEGRWGATLLVAAGLLLAGPVVRRLLVPALRPTRHRLARRLDDLLGWHDAADTALALEGRRARGAASAETPLEAFVVAWATGRLRDVEPDRLWPGRRDGVWLARVLALAFAFVLLAPGVSGLLGERGAGQGPDGLLGATPEGPSDADRWLREHARIVLAPPSGDEAPLALTARVTTDAPLPAAWRGAFDLVWDGEALPLEARLDAEAGATVDHPLELPLSTLDVLEGRLVPGTHVAQVHLRPREGPWTVTVESNEVEVELDPSAGGGGGRGPPPPGAPPPPQEQPSPEPPPSAPPPPSEQAPGGPEEGDAPPPPEEEHLEVVEPLVREDGETVRKENAVVAVPDPEAGLAPPRPVPLEDALRDLDAVVERAMGQERLTARDRDFLRRYFRALQQHAGAGGR